MLVLTRTVGQRVLIKTPAGDIWITLCDVLRRDRAKISIDAPSSMVIQREEIIDRYASKG